MLADTVDASNCLKFKCSVDEGFGKNNMGRVYEIEARRVSAGVEEECFYLRVVSDESIEMRKMDLPKDPP